MSGFIFGLALLLTSPGADSRKAAPGAVWFKGREVDIRSVVDGFPYDPWRWAGSAEHNILYCLKREGQGKYIYGLEFKADGPAALLGGARRLSPEDFSKSLTFHWKVRESDGSLFFIKDQNNDERFNLYWLDRAGTLARLTDVAYVSDFGLSPDGKRVAYSERMGPEKSRYRIHVLDLESRRDRVIAQDTAGQQFTWYNLSWQPNGRGIALTTLTDGDRNRGNISYIRTDGSEDQRPRVLTDKAVPRTFPEASKYWVRDSEVLFRSNENGAANLYAVDVDSGRQRAITAFGSDVAAAFLTTETTPRQIVICVKNPLKSALYRIDAAAPGAKPQLLFEDKTDIDLLDVTPKGRILARVKSADLPFRADLITPRDGRADPVACVRLDPEVLEKVVHSDARAVMYDTFDKVPMTIGGQEFAGKIHGYLYTPKRPLPKADQLVLVRAFYGGANHFDPDVQLLCAAGLHVFDPAPRGVADISAAFERLNDGDMGGYEVIDVMYGGKYVSERLGLPPSRIGVFGHSHGGYEVLRHLTFPGKVGTAEFRFDWGFGISGAGFSSIEGQYEKSNIREWITKEAGSDRNQWKDRSPITHADKLRGRLLLTHGTNDKRVPFAESQALYDKLVELGKRDRVRLLALQGGGHVPISTEELIAQYEAWFSFLDAQK